MPSFLNRHNLVIRFCRSCRSGFFNHQYSFGQPHWLSGGPESSGCRGSSMNQAGLSRIHRLGPETAKRGQTENPEGRDVHTTNRRPPKSHRAPSIRWDTSSRSSGKARKTSADWSGPSGAPVAACESASRSSEAESVPWRSPILKNRSRSD